MLDRAYHWEVGINSVTLAEWHWRAQGNEWEAGPFPAWPWLGYLPAGTQLQVRATSNGTAEAQDVGLYLFRQSPNRPG